MAEKNKKEPIYFTKTLKKQQQKTGCDWGQNIHSVVVSIVLLSCSYEYYDSQYDMKYW